MSLTVEKDHGDLAVDLGKALLKLYDFNNGQRSIAEGSNISATVKTKTQYEYAGTIGTIDSSIVEYNFEIDASHPEAISQAISEVTSTVKDTMESLYNYNDTWDIGDGAESVVARNENYLSTFSKLGIFI